MSSAFRVLAIVASAALLIPLCGFAPNVAKSYEAEIGADIIVTAAPAYEPLAALRGAERFPKGAQLLVVHEGKTEPLIKGLAASADANVSFDGKTVLFAGKQAASDPWQIWELTLADRSVRKVIATATDAVRPLYLPGGRMVWAQRVAVGISTAVRGGRSSAGIHVPESYRRSGSVAAHLHTGQRLPRRCARGRAHSL